MRELPTCTECKRPLRIIRGGLECPFCRLDFRIVESYYRSVSFLTAFAMFLLGWATYKPSSNGVWLLWVILSGIPIWIFFSRVIPPRIMRGRRQTQLSFFRTYFLAVYLICGIEFVVIMSAMYLIGGSQREIKEQLEMLSL